MDRQAGGCTGRRVQAGGQAGRRGVRRETGLMGEPAAGQAGRWTHGLADKRACGRPARGGQLELFPQVPRGGRKKENIQKYEEI